MTQGSYREFEASVKHRGQLPKAVHACGRTYPCKGANQSRHYAPKSYESVTHKMASNVPSGTFTKAKVLVICLARQSNCSETKHLWTVSTAPGYAVSTITHHAEPCTLRDITKAAQEAHFGNLGAVWRGGTL
ncbi:uncharacterized protein MYCGRDRAFT_97246 [Zymoseptoria tritici IPO323]|uniref:Uncharacterized protein n=1 Tax=Zymoseptoria tritici (strain CBS 115943 / IPO323) TaxID=336722 RepID=F9XPL0_ZYMTI|nr:uncharacterized protein MYCGRDRAFT_97246 [Zymoseptoria tritici IPO323]EGP82485.1 hypothetical protein MYCGRDRAFT_97246 [Zymoseptoria tritici IPO323]